MHGTLYGCIGRSGIHHVEQNVDDFIAAGDFEGTAGQEVVLEIDEDEGAVGHGKFG